MNEYSPINLKGNQIAAVVVLAGVCLMQLVYAWTDGFGIVGYARYVAVVPVQVVLVILAGGAYFLGKPTDHDVQGMPVAPEAASQGALWAWIQVLTVLFVIGLIAGFGYILYHDMH